MSVHWEVYLRSWGRARHGGGLYEPIHQELQLVSVAQFRAVARGPYSQCGGDHLHWVQVGRHCFSGGEWNPGDGVAASITNVSSIGGTLLRGLLWGTEYGGSVTPWDSTLAPADTLITPASRPPRHIMYCAHLWDRIQPDVRSAMPDIMNGLQDAEAAAQQHIKELTDEEHSAKADQQAAELQLPIGGA